MSKEEFVQAFQEKFGGYICVENEVVKDFYNESYQNLSDKGFEDESILDYCQDYVLSQGLEEEVVE